MASPVRGGRAPEDCTQALGWRSPLLGHQWTQGWGLG